MNLLQTYRAKRQLLAQLQAELAVLDQDPALKAELEFVDKFEALLKQHGKTVLDAIQVLDPQLELEEPPRAVRKRTATIYTNPHTQEQISTKGANRRLREWRDQYGENVVKSWGTKTSE